jgi:hypothetical protein
VGQIAEYDGLLRKGGSGTGIEQAPENKTTIATESLYKAVTGREARFKPEKTITDKTFEVFDKVSEYEAKRDKGEEICEKDVSCLFLKNL